MSKSSPFVKFFKFLHYKYNFDISSLTITGRNLSAWQEREEAFKITF